MWSSGRGENSALVLLLLTVFNFSGINILLNKWQVLKAFFFFNTLELTNSWLRTLFLFFFSGNFPSLWSTPNYTSLQREMVVFTVSFAITLFFLCWELLCALCKQSMSASLHPVPSLEVGVGQLLSLNHTLWHFHAFLQVFKAPS